MWQWISDYQVHFFDIAELPQEQTAHFQSDFAFVAASLNRSKAETPPCLDHWLFHHPGEAVQFLLALKRHPLS